MSYGYSQRLVERNKDADNKSVGVALGRVCIKKNVPVSTVATALGVTRATVYNWFTGLCKPHAKYYAEIQKLIKRHAG
jgi:predicted transcriptional regulator